MRPPVDVRDPDMVGVKRFEVSFSVDWLSVWESRLLDLPLLASQPAVLMPTPNPDLFGAFCSWLRRLVVASFDHDMDASP